jgi:hypothetical protein
MTDWNDLPDEMRRLRLGEDTVDRLLAGGIDPDDAPPGYSEVARVLQAATAADLQEELAHEAVHVGLAMELVKQPSPASTPSVGRSKNMGSRSRRIKVGGLVVVGVLMGSTGLAAAGFLPDAAQDAFSSVLDRVGITVPANGDHHSTSGEEISEIATTTDATGLDKGAEISSAASGGKSQAGQHGSAGAGTSIEGAGSAPVPAPNEGGTGSAPVPVPNEGGTGTADTASDGASEEGTSIADEESDGRSGSGSANASVAPSVPVVVPEPPVEQGP